MSSVQSQREREKNKGFSLDKLSTALDNLSPIFDAAERYRQIKKREEQKEAKMDQAKIKEFEDYLYPIYAAAKTKGEMMNRIFDEHHIDDVVKGFGNRQMGYAVKHIIPEYKDRSIEEMDGIIEGWIREANKLRIENESGSLIHPTPYGGHLKFRWHIENLEDDYKKQQENLTLRIQFANKTSQDRADEWNELEQKRQQQEEPIQQPQEQEIVITTDGQTVGGE